MSDPIDEIIRRAMANGEFDNLANKGKKLNLDQYFELPEDLRVGYAMLKNANFPPAEVELLREIAELEEKLKTATEDQRGKIQTEIADKRLKYNLMLEGGRRRR
ncbi:MAG: DUF1992 domain-containing protein [Anaerolineales bacterium]|jgi:hypothetical protein|nr:DUF1992 domain-containing protein [Anaerolineales bacterium]